MHFLNNNVIYNVNFLQNIKTLKHLKINFYTVIVLYMLYGFIKIKIITNTFYLSFLKLFNDEKNWF